MVSGMRVRNLIGMMISEWRASEIGNGNCDCLRMGGCHAHEPKCGGVGVNRKRRHRNGRNEPGRIVQW